MASLQELGLEKTRCERVTLLQSLPEPSFLLHFALVLQCLETQTAHDFKWLAFRQLSQRTAHLLGHSQNVGVGLESADFLPHFVLIEFLIQGRWQSFFCAKPAHRCPANVFHPVAVGPL